MLRVKLQAADYVMQIFCNVLILKRPLIIIRYNFIRKLVPDLHLLSVLYYQRHQWYLFPSVIFPRYYFKEKKHGAPARKLVPTFVV